MSYSTGWKEGYKTALLGMAEKINNASSNGERQHWDTELLDQLIELGDEGGVEITSEEVLDQ